MALVVQNLHASAGDMSHGFTSWGWKGPLEEGMQPTAVFLPAESHGQRRLAGCTPQDCKK